MTGHNLYFDAGLQQMEKERDAAASAAQNAQREVQVAAHNVREELSAAHSGQMESLQAEMDAALQKYNGAIRQVRVDGAL